MMTQKPGKKALRRDARVAAAIAAGRKTFSQLRAERWQNASQKEREERYQFKNLGHRKHGMIGVN
jgi:hypothetical protein